MMSCGTGTDAPHACGKSTERAEYADAFSGTRESKWPAVAERRTSVFFRPGSRCLTFHTQPAPGAQPAAVGSRICGAARWPATQQQPR